MKIAELYLELMGVLGNHNALANLNFYWMNVFDKDDIKGTEKEILKRKQSDFDRVVDVTEKMNKLLEALAVNYVKVDGVEYSLATAMSIINIAKRAPEVVLAQFMPNAVPTIKNKSLIEEILCKEVYFLPQMTYYKNMERLGVTINEPDEDDCYLVNPLKLEAGFEYSEDFLRKLECAVLEVMLAEEVR